LTVFLSLLLTYFLLKLILPFLRNNFADMPNHRSLHKSSIPSGGGIIFVIIGIIGMIFSGNYSALLCFPLSIVGFWDDKVSLNALFRYFIHLITASLLLFFSPVGIYFYQNISPFLLIPVFIFYLLSATAIINFINFMDGLDGLVGSCMALIIGLYCLIVDASFLPIFGAILGFLILNWPPAKVFMGDAGSTFLGAVFVLFLLNTNSVEKSFALLFVGMPLLVDSSVCVIRRFLDRQKIFEAHSLHLFQRLHKAGWSHRKITTVYLISSLSIALTYIVFGILSSLVIMLFSILFGLWVDKKYAIPFKV